MLVKEYPIVLINFIIQLTLLFAYSILLFVLHSWGILWVKLNLNK